MYTTRDRTLAETVIQRLSDLDLSLRDAAVRAEMSETTLRKVTKMRGQLRDDKLADLALALHLYPTDLARLRDGDVTQEEVLSRPRPTVDRGPNRRGVSTSPDVHRDAAGPASVDFLSGHLDQSPAEIVEFLEDARPHLDGQAVGLLVELAVARALDELVAGTGWSVDGARPDWGADLVVADDEGTPRVLVETKAAPTRGFLRVDEAIGRAVRVRARMSRTWEREVDFWVVYDSDPGPQVVEAFGEVGVPMGWIGSLPELPDRTKT